MTFFKIKSLQQQTSCWYPYFVALLRIVAENVVTSRQTDRQTDKLSYKPSTVTLAAHARRRLITGDYYFQRKETGRSGYLPQQLLWTTIIEERKLVGVDTYRNNYWGLLLSKKGNWSEWILTATITGDYYYRRKETGRSGYLPQQLLGTTIIEERKLVGVDTYRNNCCGLLLSKKGNWSEWTLTATITGDYYYQRKETGGT